MNLIFHFQPSTDLVENVNDISPQSNLQNSNCVNSSPQDTTEPESTSSSTYSYQQVSSNHDDFNENTGSKFQQPTPLYSSQSSTTTDYINDVTYKKFLASKFGEEALDEIDIIDVNVNEHMKNNTEYLKTLSQEQPEEYKGIMPSSTAKRKHQITYLAYQAKQKELQLKNEWAANRLTKAQTRAKYGF